jgi:hypothetical protein
MRVLFSGGAADTACPLPLNREHRAARARSYRRTRADTGAAGGPSPMTAGFFIAAPGLLTDKRPSARPDGNQEEGERS